VYAPPTDGNLPNFVGHYADAINKGEPLRLPGGGTPKRDLLHVDDLSRACQAFVDSIIQHGLYNLGGGTENATTLKQLIADMEEISGLQAVIDDQHPLPPPVPLDYISDLSLVRQELDWEPRIGLTKGLATLFSQKAQTVP
jgi:nucleoside-diphosphate-sugar epimerase